jgi:hypothetical protein
MKQATQGDPLAVALLSRGSETKDYWTFASSTRRRGAHGLFRYPAMMVPEVQGALLDAVVATNEVGSVYDPFLGAGTMVIESLVRGLDIYGTDLNPLAILLSQVKCEPPEVEAIDAFISQRDPRPARYDMDVDTPTIRKWFQPGVAVELAQIRSEILLSTSQVLRRFLWICLAETVRLVSNSRTSTFKLHAYSPSDLVRRTPKAAGTFDSVVRANRARIETYWADLAASPRRGCSTIAFTKVQDDKSDGKFDVLMTSPPYGDNKTTVPYGQYSFLPLLFIDFGDIPGNPSTNLLDSTLRIDSESLGGSLVRADQRQDELLSVTPSLGPTLERLADAPSLRRKVVSFMGDYEIAVSSAASRLRQGGLSFWTLGERRVGGEQVPLVAATLEILESLGHREVCTVDRTFPKNGKRMALRNSQGLTMSSERILVTRAGG